MLLNRCLNTTVEKSVVVKVVVATAVEEVIMSCCLYCIRKDFNYQSLQCKISINTHNTINYCKKYGCVCLV